MNCVYVCVCVNKPMYVCVCVRAMNHIGKLSMNHNKHDENDCAAKERQVSGVYLLGVVISLYNISFCPSFVLRSHFFTFLLDFHNNFPRNCFALDLLYTHFQA